MTLAITLRVVQPVVVEPCYPPIPSDEQTGVEAPPEASEDDLG